MRLPESVESGLHLCVLLATLPPGSGLPATQLAEFHRLPAAATAKLLQQLAAAGVLEPREGRSGGYQLAKPAGGITVGDIVAALDGPAPAFRCREIRQRGPCAAQPERYSARCAIARLMDDAQDAWWQTLHGRSLEELAKSVSDQVDDEIRESSRQWLRERVRT